MRNRIICQAMKEMNEYGIKFTMNDLARHLGISKRTLYENFASKEELIGFILKMVLAEIKAEREAIVNNDQLSIQEKFRQILTIRSSICAESTDRAAIDIKKYMPELWKKAERDMEEMWQIMENLICEGEKIGCFRKVFFPALRVMFKGAFHEFANHSYLLQHKITIHEMLDRMTDILLFGVVSQENHQHYIASSEQKTD